MAKSGLEKLSGDRLHFGAVRLRVNGFGNLHFTLSSLDDVKSQQLAVLPLQTATNIEPVRLSNFTEERASLELNLLGKDEWFFLTKIMIFVKPVATSIPQ